MELRTTIQESDLAYGPKWIGFCGFKRVREESENDYWWQPMFWESFDETGKPINMKKAKVGDNVIYKLTKWE